MSQAEYDAAIERTLMAVEDALDNCEWDIDYERAGAVLTLTLEDNGTQVILSRQSANRELWVAAKSGGYHLAFENPGWKCSTTGEDLPALLDRVLTEQQGEPVSLELEGV
ncbi:iron donor protein CyaY [Microbulbifer thermotolerans]|uniref:Iron-sulfur cluster assembly protein CyaY n=1 Tax=Microbulbifer thermotolerans TaxID=252514 RepID=A0AB35HT54_MICTH|nr:iron donor protein CyaY [Microbulbifer thermotolerans]MCX2779092.1 iron donor protein CyaY [Microbulbifer thermotolerans]MCX2782722.1 iron donor protein CyaY [Microbulbifer thermotolerans]MCX2800190.1 iron donor protein CyaY [Microbulbifer thermotolerans]MCX2805276.1 iron donor protein CyaY [Microbulbifer thermotolerans]MCX2831791.1 iron donor protein CyaY [Microbulbifer thermotolerans]